MAGFAFPGTPPTLTMYQAVLDLDDPERSLAAGWHRTAEGVFARGPIPRRLFMLDFSGTPEDRQAPVTREEVEAVLRRISGADVRVAAMDQANRWTDNTRLVDTYRCGRVLLAGDAAHVHSPFGGQGLSLGLADAANLGWKLAAVIRGEMPDALLDTYTVERRPVAEAVLANTLAQVAIMRPDPQSGAMRDIVANLLRIDDVNRRFGEMMRGLSGRYDLGPDLDGVGRLIGDRPVACRDGDASLYGLMQDGTGVLLDASADGAASRLAAAGTGRIRCIAVDRGPVDADPPRRLRGLDRRGGRHGRAGGGAPPLVRADAGGRLPARSDRPPSGPLRAVERPRAVASRGGSGGGVLRGAVPGLAGSWRPLENTMNPFGIRSRPSRKPPGLA